MGISVDGSTLCVCTFTALLMDDYRLTEETTYCIPVHILLLSIEWTLPPHPPHSLSTLPPHPPHSLPTLHTPSPPSTLPPHPPHSLPTLQSRRRTSSPSVFRCDYNVYSTFQSHEPEFDYLKSLEIEEKINQISWVKPSGSSLFLLTTNGRQEVAQLFFSLAQHVGVTGLAVCLTVCVSA